MYTILEQGGENIHEAKLECPECGDDDIVTIADNFDIDNNCPKCKSTDVKCIDSETHDMGVLDIWECTCGHSWHVELSVEGHQYKISIVMNLDS